MKTILNIVWLKRDLRLNDHQAFYEAEKAAEDYLPIYIFEPSALAYPDSSLRHQQFIYQSIMDMNKKLRDFNREVLIFYEEAVQVFDYLSSEYEIKCVFSYQETGIQQTWNRDKEVNAFLNQRGIEWKEFEKDAVIRGIKNRDHWDQHWYAQMNKPLIKNQFSAGRQLPFENPFPIKKSFVNQLMDYPKAFQKAGEKEAWKYLNSFLNGRGADYYKYISKPSESRKSGGRISPYLSWGNLSVKQAYQTVKFHPNYNLSKRSYGGFLTRLKWRSHFVQKFEVEVAYESRCVNRGYEAMPYSNRSDFLEAWKTGRTGYPLVDACMRCLHETGWINFRMRAMLVSMLCHHLDIDWRLGVYHLAGLFLDYEPGIHFPQFQMQAGTTGINTVRIYNPVKQSLDHDPEGIFIKKWVAELRAYPTEFIHEPWKISQMEKQLYKITADYPLPAVDQAEAAKKARRKIWGHRKNAEVQAENTRILMTHTRQKKLFQKNEKK